MAGSNSHFVMSIYLFTKDAKCKKNNFKKYSLPFLFHTIFVGILHWNKSKADSSNKRLLIFICSCSGLGCPINKGPQSLKPFFRAGNPAKKFDN